MTPIKDVTTIPSTATIAEFNATVRQRSHARLPVRDERAAAIIGTVNFFDVASEHAIDDTTPVLPHMRPPLFIPEGTPIMEIFTRLRLSRQPMCMVANAQSETIGLITAQDVLEEIVGKL